jgi:hypothetical protein
VVGIRLSGCVVDIELIDKEISWLSSSRAPLKSCRRPRRGSESRACRFIYLGEGEGLVLLGKWWWKVASVGDLIVKMGELKKEKRWTERGQVRPI